ncbi:MAG: RnfABCDGE type electron transport complex subunit G [Pseudomonadales bacterium]|nr:RnfABCDGE type electron transport complex subunit G [Pseudomonadales bacterium]
MKQIILRLTLICLICGTALSLTHLLTSATITNNKSNYAMQQLYAVLVPVPVSLRGETLIFEPLADKVFSITHDEKLAGHIFQISTTEGYNGEMIFWLAVSTTNTVLGVRTIRHSETPGLADKIERHISNWVLSFNNRSLANSRWQVKKDNGDFDQFTGATITPRAVVAAIKLALTTYSAHQYPWQKNAQR